MGKRVTAPAVETHNLTRSIRRRRRNKDAASIANKLQLHAASSELWHENDDEDSSNDAVPVQRKPSSKQANNSSILLNNSASSFNNTNGAGVGCDRSDNLGSDSPRPTYTLRPSLVNGTVLTDLTQNSWRLGKPIGKGNFGEIFLASANITVPATNDNSKYVVKIEPHSNGPLFVEIHCLMNTAEKKADEHFNISSYQKSPVTTIMPTKAPSGIPDYIASGSHYFGNARYRFLVLPRYDRDLHSIIKNCRVQQKWVLTLAINIINVLENLHDKGYCHNDVKAQNLMISKCKFYKQTAGKAALNINAKYNEQTTDSGNSSEQDGNEDDHDGDDAEDKFIIKRSRSNLHADEEDEDFDDGATTNSLNSNSMDNCSTPLNRANKRRARNMAVEFSGSNPVRSCRRQKPNYVYDEMVKSHYLRPVKRISYSECFNEDGTLREDADNAASSSEADGEEFKPSRFIKKQAALTTRCVTVVARTRQSDKAVPEKAQNCSVMATAAAAVEQETIFLIDYGLASKYLENGKHRPFVMDQRRAHDGTLEFTSRDAHLGAHSRRSDLECLGYNMIFWSQGYLPWKEAALQQQQENVHRAKEYLMMDVREMLKQIYGKQVPKFLGEFLHLVGKLGYTERPDYTRYRRLFEREYQKLGFELAHMQLNSVEIARSCVRVKQEALQKTEAVELNKGGPNMLLGWHNMLNQNMSTPNQERTLSNRVSPKNLRSKSGKKTLKNAKILLTEIATKDPDQIAHERAMREYDLEVERQKKDPPKARQYEGQPTYAIIELQQRLKLNGCVLSEKDEHDDEEEDDCDEDDEVADDDAQEQEDEEEDCNDKNYDESEEDEEEEEEDCDDDEANITKTQNNGQEQEDTEYDEDDDEDESKQEAEDDDDVKLESDSTEINEQAQQGRRTRRTRTQKTVRACVNGSNNNNAKLTAKKLSSTKAGGFTKENRSVTTVVREQIARGRATRLAQHKNAAAKLLAASAAGEIEHNDSSSNDQQRNGVAGYALVVRRKRRCLQKTDELMELDSTEEDDSSSNYNPKVRRVLHAYKYNNENIYMRGRAAAASRHYRK